MNIAGLQNQSVIVYPKTTYAADGRETVGSGTAENWRIEPKSKTIFSPRGTDKGALLTIDATGYAPANTVAAIDSKVTHGGNTYKVYAKYPVPGRNGQTHHHKVQLLRWQA